MNLPSKGDYIDIHNHEGRSSPGHFSIENLMAHEQRVPDFIKGSAYTIGIHPWHLTSDTYNEQIEKVRTYADHNNIIAIGEAGFDRLKGPDHDLQKKALEEQVAVSGEVSKPVFIHCVRSWDELLAVHKRMMPSKPWIIHGFRGKKELALQLVSKGMYISFWFDFIIRPESADLVRNIPPERIFLETDGSWAKISDIYEKVSSDLGVEVEDLKERIYKNFIELFIT
ncbi:MAG: TatD family hydrolase [Bacteroidales bacterium]|jgi:TatD DNase family protein